MFLLELIEGFKDNLFLLCNTGLHTNALLAHLTNKKGKTVVLSFG